MRPGVRRRRRLRTRSANRRSSRCSTPTWGALRDGCARFIHCRYDGGALAALPFEPADFSYLKPDDPFAYTHPSVQGLAKLAEAAWKAGFDFADATAPVSKASRSGAVVTLSASDNAGVAGVEYRLAARGAWIRYSRPVHIPKGKALVWRAVDVNGNCEATHSLHA